LSSDFPRGDSIPESGGDPRAHPPAEGCSVVDKEQKVGEAAKRSAGGGDDVPGKQNGLVVL
jgi:hypothetical protein